MGRLLKIKYCKTCHIVRPYGCSHCKICNNCVDKFDHHCPWVGNCIGKNNYVMFICFITSFNILLIFTLIKALWLVLELQSQKMLLCKNQNANATLIADESREDYSHNFHQRKNYFFVDATNYKKSNSYNDSSITSLDISKHIDLNILNNLNNQINSIFRNLSLTVNDDYLHSSTNEVSRTAHLQVAMSNDNNNHLDLFENCELMSNIYFYL